MQVQAKIAPTSSLPSNTSGNRLLKYILVVLVFLPVFATFFYIRSLSFEVPIQDDWDLFVPHFQHLAAGQLTWSDINSQHNESVVFFPLALALLSAKITGGQLLAITYVSYFFLCGSLGFLFLFFRMLRLPGRWSVLWFLPVSLLFLGWRQWEGLLWSTHLLNTMALFFILAAIYCCTQVARAPIFFVAAIACAWIASFSMASGLLVWLSGAAALGFSGPTRRFEDTLRYAVGWLVMAAACGICFLMDVVPHVVPWPSGLAYVLANPLTAVHYALTYLGAPFGATALEATFAGLVVVLLAVPVLYFGVRSIRTAGVLTGLLMSSYVGLALVPLLMGRLGLGVGQAFSSRYVTLGALAPIGIYFSSLALARTVPVCRYLVAASILLMAIGIANSYTSGLEAGRVQWAFRSNCAGAIKNFHQVARQDLLCGYPDPGVILERAPLLERYHLSLFAQ